MTLARSLGSWLLALGLALGCLLALGSSFKLLALGSCSWLVVLLLVPALGTAPAPSLRSCLLFALARSLGSCSYLALCLCFCLCLCLCCLCLCCLCLCLCCLCLCLFDLLSLIQMPSKCACGCGLRVSQAGSYTKNCASREGVVSDTHGKLARYMALPEVRIAMKKNNTKHNLNYKEAYKIARMGYLFRTLSPRNFRVYPHLETNRARS
jgi:hypothetical protein